MRRRTFLAGLGGAAAVWPLAARAQTLAVPVIGYLSSRSAAAEAAVRAPFLDGLAKGGFAVGKNVTIEYAFADGHPERLAMLAAELVAHHAALFVGTDPASAAAAKTASPMTPLIFTSGQDPVQLGLVVSLNRPGGNATGVSLFTTELGPKRLQLLRELLRSPPLIAFVVVPNQPSTPKQIAELQAAADAMGQALLVVNAGSDSELDEAFATITQRKADGVLFGASTFFQVVADKLVALAARHALPALYEWRESVMAGGLMSYSTSRSEVGQLLGNYAARILNGIKPADLPVIQSTKFELVINLKTAKALRLTVPQSILAQADEVIE